MRNFGPGMIAPNARPIDVMATYMGVRETGPNRGPWVDTVLRFCGLEPDPSKNPRAPRGGYPWCAASLVWCCHRAGEIWVPKIAGVARLWDRIPQDRRVTEPQIGDAFVHIRPDRKGHCGLIRGFDGARVLTIEGNTNVEGSREGNAVAPQDRPRWGYFSGFFRLR